MVYLAYADDKAFFLQDADDLVCIRSGIELYCKASGAKINVAKSHLLILDASSSPDEYTVAMPDVQVVSNTKYLGINVLGPAIVAPAVKLDTSLRKWVPYKPPLMGRVSIANRFLSSLFIFYLSTLPPGGDISELNSKLSKFVWNSPVPAVASPCVFRSQQDGGLGLRSLEDMHQAIHLSIIGRIHSAFYHPEIRLDSAPHWIAFALAALKAGNVALPPAIANLLVFDLPPSDLSTILQSGISTFYKIGGLGELFAETEEDGPYLIKREGRRSLCSIPTRYLFGRITNLPTWRLSHARPSEAPFDKAIFKLIHNGPNGMEERELWWRFVARCLVVRDRLHHGNPRSKLCVFPGCNMPETQDHVFTECVPSLVMFSWLRTIIGRVKGWIIPTDIKSVLLGTNMLWTILRMTDQCWLSFVLGIVLKCLWRIRVMAENGVPEDEDLYVSHLKEVLHSKFLLASKFNSIYSPWLVSSSFLWS